MSAHPAKTWADVPVPPCIACGGAGYLTSRTGQTSTTCHSCCGGPSACPFPPYHIGEPNVWFTTPPPLADERDIDKRLRR